LRCEKALALAAQKRIIQQQQYEQAEAEQAAKRERTVEAARHADAIAALNVSIDALLSLADLFAQRSNALQALASTGVVESGIDQSTAKQRGNHGGGLSCPLA
jgi:hypothetical protein